VYGRIAQTDVSRKINGSHIKRHSLESVSRCELLEDFLSFPKTSTENRGSRVSRRGITKDFVIFVGDGSSFFYV
jgi:hypothetical protein